jgi:predicted secreted protein
LTLLLMATGDQMALAQSPPPAVTVTGNGSGGAQARVGVGQELDNRLSANPTTGYVWRYRPDPPPLLGLGGVQVFTFEATAAGTVALRFEYRKGEAGEPVRSFGLDITVLP